ncbi:MAG: PilN domain-containing protein [Polaromonas sp.]|nr:PilN domain-containing protein [Polaromonas sp.]
MLINLLPHRKWALARKRKNFATALGMAALLGLVFAVASSVWMGHQLTAQRAANDILKNEIATVDALLKISSQVKADIVKLRLRETTLQAFQGERKMAAFWLQALADSLPDDLYLTALKQEGNKVNIKGLARSNDEVFELLRQVTKRGQWFAQAELIEVTAAPLTLDALALNGTPFAMRALLKQPNEKVNAEQPLSDAH